MTTNAQILLREILQGRQAETQEADFHSVFETFTAEQVLKDFDLSYDEIESGLIGGPGDGGIDSIFLLANGELVQEDSSDARRTQNVTLDLIISQSTIHSGFQEVPIQRFISVSTDLFDLSKQASALSRVYNERLVDAIGRFRVLYQKLAPSFPALRVTFCYASMGREVNPQVKHKVDQLKAVVTSHFSQCEFEFRFLGANELLALARRSPPKVHSLILAENPISSGHQVGFVCLVRLHDFFRFITDDTKAIRRQIFEANVRDYQGRTEVNDEIQASLRNKTVEDFWWLNNGVSIVSTKASLSGKTLTIEEPQIVNGLQTAREIYDHYVQLDDPDDKRTILVRVMVPDREESRDRVIKATNSQTAVLPASLRATDKVHRDIEEYLGRRGLFYDRRKNYYKNEGKPRSRIISIQHLAQSVMAIVLQRPDTARARPSSLLKADDDYKRVFNSAHPIKLYYVCAEAMSRVENYLKSPQANMAAKDRNNLRFYVAMHAVAGVDKPQKSMNEIAQFDVAGLDHTAIQRSLAAILPKYVELGGDDQAAKGPQLLNAILN